jgi:hypothetical protein
VSEITIVRAALLLYFALIVIQFISWIVARIRQRPVSGFEAGPIAGGILVAFDLVRMTTNSLLAFKVLGAVSLAVCLFVLGRKAARGEIWSAGETNLVALACLGAAALFIDVPAVVVTLMVLAALVGTVATALFVRAASGSSAPAR